MGAAFLDAGGDDVAVGVGFLFHDEHGHVDQCGGLRFEVHGESVLAGAVGVVERGEDVLRGVGGVKEAEHGVVAVGHAPVVGVLAAAAAHRLGGFHLEFKV